MKPPVVVSAEEQSAWNDVLLHATEATRIRCSDSAKSVANLKATQDALGRLLEILNRDSGFYDVEHLAVFRKKSDAVRCHEDVRRVRIVIEKD